MSTISSQLSARPVPVPDGPSAPFFEAARRGELLLQLCDQCGSYMWPVKPRCVVCFAADPGWQPASGRGVLYSFAIVHRVAHPAFAALVPYNLAIVELEEGVRIRTTVADGGPDELEIGMPLEVAYEALSAEVSVPQFRAASA